MFGNFKMKFVEQECYLGDTISAQGLEESVSLTVERRAGKVKGSMYETKSIMEDFRMQAVGGMAGAWDLWESAIGPPSWPTVAVGSVLGRGSTTP